MYYGGQTEEPGHKHINPTSKLKKKGMTKGLKFSMKRFTMDDCSLTWRWLSQSSRKGCFETGQGRRDYHNYVFKLDVCVRSCTHSQIGYISTCN